MFSHNLITVESGQVRTEDSEQIIAMKEILVAMKYYLTACAYNQIIDAYIVDQIKEKGLDKPKVKELQNSLSRNLDINFSIKSSQANEGSFLSFISTANKLTRENQVAILDRLDPSINHVDMQSGSSIQRKLMRLLGELAYNSIALSLNVPTLSDHMKSIQDTVIPKEEEQEFTWTIYPKVNKANSDISIDKDVLPDPVVRNSSRVHD